MLGVPLPQRYTLFPYTTLFRSSSAGSSASAHCPHQGTRCGRSPEKTRDAAATAPPRSEEHTSELQSRRDLVCRLLLEKKKRPLKRRDACVDVTLSHVLTELYSR